MLFVDPNVGHSPTKTRAQRAQEIIDTLRLLGAPAKLQALAYGDIAFKGNNRSGEAVDVGIELKTVGGFLTDMTTGRFVGHQVPGMQEAYQYRYLILEGVVRPSARDGLLEVHRGGRWCPASPRIMYTALVKFLDDISVRGGFRVWRSWGSLETKHQIAGIYGEWQKPWHKRKGLEHFDESRDTVMLDQPSLVRLWARDCPGIGWTRSAAVDKAFGDPLELAEASPRQWAQIPGIGKVTARKVWRAIRGLK